MLHMERTKRAAGKKAERSGNWILLDFGQFSMPARLFDTRIAAAFYNKLPLSIELIAWGNELYGAIGDDLGSENPQEQIPAGGLAYTNRGNYFCIFFGQTPAWPVEYIGSIDGEGWKRLLKQPCNKVTILPQPIECTTIPHEKGAAFPVDDEGKGGMKRRVEKR